LEKSILLASEFPSPVESAGVEILENVISVLAILAAHSANKNWITSLFQNMHLHLHQSNPKQFKYVNVP
jgi:hypothetical protein